MDLAKHRSLSLRFRALPSIYFSIISDLDPNIPRGGDDAHYKAAYGGAFYWEASPEASEEEWEGGGCSLCYTIVQPGRKSGFQAGF